MCNTVKIDSLAKNSAETLEVLEAHRLTWQAFAKLRSDSYVQKLARHSPAQFNEFLSLIFAPGLSAREKMAKCPPWPPGSKNEGKTPTLWLVWNATNRLNEGRAMDLASEMNQETKKFLGALAKLPFAQTKEVTEMLCALLSHELLSAKLEQGTKVSEQTKALDSLLRKQKLNLYAQSREHARKDDQLRAMELSLEESKSFPEVQDLFKAAFAALKKARTSTK
ncbi:MAG TPA: hypothetical protein VH251_10335 [Verrucomicrobiae bacterium]|nr:hypothetical protein [Verrucomicrobiae bacterium]